jgi:hypothetical protein
MATKKIPGHGSSKVENSSMDKKMDKKAGIKEGSAKDMAMDKKIGAKLVQAKACGGRIKKGKK